MIRFITEDQAIQIVGDAEELRQMVVKHNYRHGELAMLRSGAKLALFPGKVLPRFVVYGYLGTGSDVNRILRALDAGRTRLLASQQVGNPIPECDQYTDLAAGFDPHFRRITL